MTNSFSKSITRRNFLSQSLWITGSALLGPIFIPESVLGRGNSTSPGDRITIGCVGVGPQGTARMRDFLEHSDAQVVAIADVKTDRLQQVKSIVDSHYENRDCAGYQDYRNLIAREDIDAVLNATPDHWHVLSALDAVKASKDVYLEKPMGLSIEEDQLLRTACRKYNRVFQFGTQQRSNRNFRFACELVRNGYIGKLQSMNVWSPASSPGGPDTPAPIPGHLDYNSWLGPAAETPYTAYKCSDRGDRKTWWYNSDYALGFIAGWGIHPMDIALWGAGDLVNGPVRVSGTGRFPEDGACDTATHWNIHLRYQSGVVINFSGVPNVSNRTSAEGQQIVQQWRKQYPQATSHGNTFDGSEGWVHVDRHGIDAHPKSLLEVQLNPEDVHLYESTQHVRNFLDCIKSRKKTICPIEDAVWSDIACHISDIAIRLERELTWDQDDETFSDDQDANRYLKRSWRSPWHA